MIYENQVLIDRLMDCANAEREIARDADMRPEDTENWKRAEIIEEGSLVLRRIIKCFQAYARQDCDDRQRRWDDLEFAILWGLDWEGKNDLGR